MNEDMNETEQEQYGLDKKNKLLKDFCNFLIDAEVDYTSTSWEDLEGTDVKVGDVIIEFSDGGRVAFRSKEVE